MSAAQPSEGGRGLQARVLLLLLLAYVFNFLDRQIVSILKIPIKAELGLTDTQLGLMGGIAFASVYSTLAIPLARYADRKGRARVIAASVFVWSGFTALCGLTQNFFQLFVARMGVGVGEAGGVAPSYALISEHFPPHRRARALAIFSLGIPLGSALGLFFGGWLAQAINWRVAFFVVGGAGIPIAWLIWSQIPEAPERAAGDPAVTTDGQSFGETFGELARKPSFWLLSFGAASASVCGYGLGFWLPSYFSEALGLSLGSIGSYFGTILLVGGIAGIFAGGVVADRLGTARPQAYAITPAIAFLLTAPAFGAAMAADSRAVGWVLFAIAYALSLAWLGPIINAVQNLVAPARRATASASFLLINNLIGIGFGTFIFGFVADQLRPTYGDQAIRYSIFAGLGFYFLAALLCALAAIRLRADMWDERGSVAAAPGA